MLWFKCAAMHDPVRPVIKQAADIGWEAKQRQIDLNDIALCLCLKR
jgi:hypothetical protein